MQVEKPNIDQNALSRQLAVYGHQAQGKLMSLRVFVHGVSGLGVEVAKNLILAGPKEVCLFDPRKVTPQEISRNFYCRPEHVGKATRAEASLDQLKDLNSSVNVHIAANDSIEYIASNFQCVVVLDNYDREYLINLNKACHDKNIGFLYAGNLGLYGFTFVDFGENHRIIDPTGEECKSVHIAAITQEERGLVCLHEEKKHGLNDGDTISFREVKGMTEINGKEFKIEVKSPHSFFIGDTRNFSAYTNGGIATEIKVPTFTKFYDLKKSLRYPYPPDSKEMPIASWQKFGVPEQLHVILNGLLSFHAKHQRLPLVLNHEDANDLKALVKEYQSTKMDIQGEDFKVESVDEKLIQHIALYGDTQISPVTSFWGGIITQEIVKLTGKFTPLKQWLHHEFFETLPDDNVPRNPGNDRYYDYHVIFGDAFVERAQTSSSFVIGAGALGCEFIKMFALMGLSTKKGGKLSVTDDDNIEISNLNRQFLFRRQHVGKNKCETACSVGKTMNSETNFNALKLRVAPENENIFNDDFWTNLDFVVNAVDNVKARQYVDGQCVWFEKPLFESGTLGTKCHSQIIIPHATISYTDIIDPPEESIPLCTLKNFPYQIEHTIQWARDYFEGTFADSSADLVSFFENREGFLEQLQKQHRQNPTTLRTKLETLNKLYLANQTKSYQKCVELGVDIFQDVFNYQIKQLLTAFPPDHIIEDTGKPFWSGLKRVPTPLEFNINDPLHLELVQAAANIYAALFKLPLNKNAKEVAELAKKVPLVPFKPKAGVKIQTDEKKKEEEPVQINDEDEQEAKKLLTILKGYNLDKSLAPAAVEFEKDDPTNYHIEFMGGVSNLRARNYKIEEADNFKIKLIAGKIIPAIATTTAMVVGAVGIQIIKFLLGKKAEAYKNVTINLALPLWIFNDPIEAIVNTDKQFDPIMAGPIKVIPQKFTKWEKIDVKGPMTLQDLKNHFENTYGIEVSMITYGTATVYSAFDKSAQARLPMKVPQAIEALTKKELPKYKRFLAVGVSGSTKDGIDCLLPDVRYQI